MHVIEVVEALDDRFGDLAEDVDANRTDLFGDGVEGAGGCQRVCRISMMGRRDEVLPAVHIFHAHDDVSFIEEGPVEGDDVRRMALVHDVQLSHNLFPHRRFQVYVDNLHAQLALARAVLISPIQNIPSLP